MADTGVITGPEGTFEVKDVVKLLGGKIGHIGVVTSGMFKNCLLYTSSMNCSVMDVIFIIWRPFRKILIHVSPKFGGEKMILNWDRPNDIT